MSEEVREMNLKRAFDPTVPAWAQRKALEAITKDKGAPPAMRRGALLEILRRES